MLVLLVFTVLIIERDLQSQSVSDLLRVKNLMQGMDMLVVREGGTSLRTMATTSGRAWTPFWQQLSVFVTSR